MKAGELRDELRRLAKDRDEHAARGTLLDARTSKLLREARDHPEVSTAEAARLAGFKRRATAYGYMERGDDDGKC